jgi:hypothetical protein
MVLISVDEFLRISLESNPGEDRMDLLVRTTAAVERKKSGMKCLVCGEPIWAIGVVACGWDGCFTCITGEADHSDDYEIDEVCWS